ncbi:virulence protein RhuM/Fic/DOC family protein [Candidatus Parcubacteria bacterium]|nr:virulence protein RhuM/Fic/DOC family protein [Candidatus Parcubacteria bacterium]
MNKIGLPKGKIVIYKTSKDEVELQVRLKDESVWLKQNEIALLFNKDRSVITKHIDKIFFDKEVAKKSNVQKMHIPNSDKPVEFYSLDVILAVGYRVSSSRAIHFRKWATKILKQYLIKGYAINEKRLLEAQNKFNELQNAVLFLQKQSKNELLFGKEAETLSLLADYSSTLTLLEQYDKGKIITKNGQKTKCFLEYKDCVEMILMIKKDLDAKKEAGELFGQERETSFKSIIKGLYVTFDKNELYETLEDKASNLLYLIIKDHPFFDGNKRIASLLFVHYLNKSNYLFKDSGERRISDGALTALALLIATSDPKDKEIMIKIIKTLL